MPRVVLLAFNAALYMVLICPSTLSTASGRLVGAPPEEATAEKTADNRAPTPGATGTPPMAAIAPATFVSRDRMFKSTDAEPDADKVPAIALTLRVFDT